MLHLLGFWSEVGGIYVRIEFLDVVLVRKCPARVLIRRSCILLFTRFSILHNTQPTPARKLAFFKCLPTYKRRQYNSCSVFLEHWWQKFRSYWWECEHEPPASSASLCVDISSYPPTQWNRDHWTSDVGLWCSGPLPCSVVMLCSTEESLLRIFVLL